MSCRFTPQSHHGSIIGAPLDPRFRRFTALQGGRRHQATRSRARAGELNMLAFSDAASSCSSTSTSSAVGRRVDYFSLTSGTQRDGPDAPGSADFHDGAPGAQRGSGLALPPGLSKDSAPREDDVVSEASFDTSSWAGKEDDHAMSNLAKLGKEVLRMSQAGYLYLNDFGELCGTSPVSGAGSVVELEQLVSDGTQNGAKDGMIVDSFLSLAIAMAETVNVSLPSSSERCKH